MERKGSVGIPRLLLGNCRRNWISEITGLYLTLSVWFMEKSTKSYESTSWGRDVEGFLI